MDTGSRRVALGVATGSERGSHEEQVVCGHEIAEKSERDTG
jgi:hypothetical protein